MPALRSLIKIVAKVRGWDGDPKVSRLIEAALELAEAIADMTDTKIDDAVVDALQFVAESSIIEKLRDGSFEARG